MKKAFRLILAAALSGLAFTSCSQDLQVDDPVLSSAKGSRIINATFASTTKTSIDALQPRFVDGDMILVSNGEEAEEVSISVSGEKAWFATDLEGDLKAVYPSAAAKMDPTNEYAIDGVKVSDTQDGTFANANISMAEIKSDEVTATFENQTALLAVTPPSGVKSFEIRAFSKYDPVSGMRVAASAINNVSDMLSGTRVITVANEKALGTFYVSLLAGSTLGSLSFDTGSQIKSIMPGSIKQDETAAGAMYTIDERNWHSYVTIGKTKWATMNVGATTVAGSPSTSYGDYFAWGETAPRYTGITITDASTVSFSGWASGFDDGYEKPYSTYTGAQLDAAHDAATQNLGASWRMPTHEEFKSLYEACGGSSAMTTPIVLSSATPGKGIYWAPADQEYLPEYSGVAGILCCDGTNKLFFPASGMVNGKLFAGSEANFWSSTLDTEGTDWAMELYGTNTWLSPQSTCKRFCGLTVRPVSE